MHRTPALTLILSVFVNLFHASTAEKCERIKIGKDHYKRYLIAAVDGYPTGIVVDPRTDNIFFILHKRNFTKGIYLLQYGSLGVKELPISSDIVGQCIGVDSRNNIIYVGTNQGLLIYEYGQKEISADRPIGDDDIKDIYMDRAADQMYITVGVHRELYMFMNDTAAVRRYDRVGKAHSFVVDSKGNDFYEHSDGKLYFYSVDLYEPVQVKGFHRELKYVLKLNNHDEAIVAVKGSLFKLRTDSVLPQKVADLGFKITGMAFDDKNNLVIGTKGKIYRYKPIDANDPCPPDDYFFSVI
ncbi:hypothetical protein EVAR_46399_1 [Eumeta japonica]|uniref:Ommochrome-binding protein n=1 Tax=Eumeta variegata TaxID=151549 RepID=A0A4C1WWT1_EUMVA|nr:hypothetical protein EVAR_46399_1 [Eumeta japonica]